MSFRGVPPAQAGRRATPTVARPWLAAAVPLVLAVAIGSLLLLPSADPSMAPGSAGLGAAGGGSGLLTDTSDWTMYMAGLAHHGAQTGSTVLSPATASNLTMVWNATTGGRIVEQPIVVNSSLYLGAWDGYEYAFNVTTGAAQWKTFVGTTWGCGVTAGRGPSSTAEYLHGTLYFTGGGEYFEALNAVNGSVEWQTFLMNNSPSVGFYGWASGSVYNGYAYVGLASGCSLPNIVGGMDKISIVSHKVVDRLVTTPPGTLGADIWGTPTYDAATNSIFASTGNDTIVQPYDQAQLQLNPKNLSIESSWTVPPALAVADGDFGTTPVMVTTSTGRLLDIAANKDGILFALNRTDLAAGALWGTRISTDASYSSIAVGKGEIYVGSSVTTVHKAATNGSVRAINPATGAIAWSYALPGKVFSSISYDNGLVAADGGNELVLLNARSGVPVWTYDANTTFQGAMSFAHGMMFVGGDNGEVYAFGLYASNAGSTGGSPHGLGAAPFLTELRAVRTVRSA